MLIHPTVERLRTLGLAAIADTLVELQNNPQAAEMPHADWLGLLIDREESDKPGAVQWLLVGSLLVGVAFSAIQRSRFQLAWRPSAAWTQNIIGGALMGFGAFLIPGSNDVLLLQGIPSFSPRALLALVAMIIVIAATIIVIRFVTGEYMRIRCVSDACIVESEAETIVLPMRRG